MAIGDIFTFNYTGAVQTMQLLAGKRYLIECWGAQGGGLGGKGGYVSGIYQPASDIVANIYVGSTTTSGTGGWNGGGLGKGSGYGRGGGGASDVRIGGTGLVNRIIVAGGGGGNSSNTNSSYIGGAGGGLVGATGNGGSAPGTGGSQSAGGYPGGSLGVGGAGLSSSASGGGGGGYYGGGGGNSLLASGGGGSSYYDGVELGYTFSNINNGNGLIKITEISTEYITLTEPTTYPYTGNTQRLSLKKGKYKLECFGASGHGPSSADKGFGGYCAGEITLDNDTDMFLNIGGQATNYLGGWNGGGSANGSYPTTTYGGGGATDIRFNANNLSNRIIVAGGGGGFGNYSQSKGGNGGGLLGIAGKSVGGMPGSNGTGGSQSAGGSYGGILGVGGTGNNSVSGQGGGGYYGGGGGGSNTGGGGGSSYYGTLENALTVEGINEGNGYIVITPLSAAKKRRYSYAI